MLYYILMNPDFPSSVVVVRQVNHLLFRDFVSSGGKVIVVEVPIYKHTWQRWTWDKICFADQ